MPPPDLAQLLAVSKLPGLPFLETRLAQNWLRDFGHEYESIEFNVRLGQGIDIAPETAPEIRRMAFLNSAKRADLVAHVAGVVDIVETKERASLGALGQLLGYAHLYATTYPGSKVRNLFVVTSMADPDAIGPYKAHGIKIAVYHTL